MIPADTKWAVIYQDMDDGGMGCFAFFNIREDAEIFAYDIALSSGEPALVLEAATLFTPSPATVQQTTRRSESRRRR